MTKYNVLPDYDKTYSVNSRDVVCYSKKKVRE